MRNTCCADDKILDTGVSNIIVLFLQAGFNYFPYKSNGDVFVFMKCDTKCFSY